MEKPSRQNHHQSSLIITSWRLDLTGTHHLLPDKMLQRMDWKPKFLFMDPINGFKRLITHFQRVIGMQNFIKENLD